MSKEEIDDLMKFLVPCNELIYDNYNALVVGFSISDRAGDAF